MNKKIALTLLIVTMVTMFVNLGQVNKNLAAGDNNDEDLPIDMNCIVDRWTE